jgi:hypothetical protein
MHCAEGQPAGETMTEAAEHRRDRLEALVREQVTDWDPEAVVRSSVRHDGLLDLTVVSHRFDGMDSREREAAFWPALGPVPKPEMIYLTYCLLLTPEEAERSFRGGSESVPAAVDSWDE